MTREQRVKVTLSMVENLNYVINKTRKDDIRAKLIKVKEDILDIMYPQGGDYNREEPK